MTFLEFESEQADRYEVLTENYWLQGMDLDEARQKAVAGISGEAEDTGSTGFASVKIA